MPDRRWERTTSPPATTRTSGGVADGRRLGSRLLWAVAAQVSSSATNLALYVGILLSSDAERFGRLVAVLGVYHLVLTLSRSLVSEAMVANDRPTSTAEAFSWAWARRRYRLIGAAAAVGVGVVGWLVDADRSTVLAVAAAMPMLIGQDGVRNLAWSRRRADLAVGLDLVWLALTVGLLACLLVSGAVRPVPVVLSWLAGGVVSGLVGVRLTPRLLADDVPIVAIDTVSPTVALSLADSEHRRADRDGAGPVDGRTPVSDEQLHRRRHSQAALVTARNLLPIVVATVVGPVPAGLLKAGLLPFTPMLNIFAGLRLVALPAMQRAAEVGSGGADGRSPLDRLIARLIGSYAVVATAGVLLTIVVVEAMTDALPGGGAVEAGIRPEVVRWGAVVAVTTVVVRPLAEAVAFGRRSAPIMRLRGLEMAAEWAGVFAAVALVGPDRVMVGWAVGMAAGGLVWVVAGLAPGDRRR